jgi:ubiquinone/menaquinone biosynthesis C-methylase UbiE
MTDLAALTERHAQVWSNGPFEKVAEFIKDVHGALVHALHPQPGERWLDLGCGSGAVAELAAGAGAQVTGVDLSPRLVDVARERAAAGGYDITYAIGDCQNLVGIDDAAFDVVSSCVGVMFAPDHAATARELARVVRSGGRIGLAAWTKEGAVGAMFAMMAPFQPPPPEGAGSPFSWGDEQYVSDLLGDAFDLSFERLANRLEDTSGEDHWQLMKSSYGPTKSLVETLGPERAEELHEAWLEHYAPFETEHGLRQEREFLLVSGVRR